MAVFARREQLVALCPRSAIMRWPVRLYVMQINSGSDAGSPNGHKNRKNDHNS
jgi:hypothetical protein